MNNYGFKITDVCNKFCEDCCRSDKAYNKNIPFDVFKNKIIDINNFEKDSKYVIALTGGEPFFYKEANYNILDLLDVVRLVAPNSKLIIRTSGWEKHSYLNEQLIKAFKLNDNLDVRLGFSLFQHNTNHINRLNNMLEILGSMTSKVRIEIIYSKNNIDATIDILNLFFNTKKISELNNAPDRHNRFLFKTNLFEVQVDMAPSYSLCSDEGYWLQKVESICPVIKTKNDEITISYDQDLSFYHCGDPYINYSLKPFNSLENTEQEIVFIKKQYELFLEHLLKTNITFKDKKERCFYCTKYILSNDRAPEQCLRGALHV